MSVRFHLPLLALGIPPIVANATSSVALWPGTVGSMWGYRGELRVLLKHGLSPDGKGGDPVPTVETLDDAEVVDLIESFR